MPVKLNLIRGLKYNKQLGFGPAVWMHWCCLIISTMTNDAGIHLDIEMNLSRVYSISVPKHRQMSRKTRWHAVPQIWFIAAIPSISTCVILGCLSAYETSPVPLKYSAVYILIPHLRLVYLKVLCKASADIFFLHFLTKWNTIGYVLC